MKRILLFTSTFVLGISGCKKIGMPAAERVEENAATQFLSLPPGSPAVLHAIIAALAQQETEHPFLQTLAQQEGLPQWGACMYNKDPYTAATTRQNEAAADTTVLVPLVLAGENRVNAFIACRVSADTALFQLYRKNDYAQYGFEPGGDTPSAHRVANMMLAMEQQVFGHQRFSITDHRLHLYKPSTFTGIRYLRVQPKQNNGRSAGVWIPTTECYETAWFYEDIDGNVTQETDWLTDTECTTTWVYLGGGGGSSGGGSGGAGGGTGGSGGGGNPGWYNPVGGGGGSGNTGGWQVYTIAGAAHFDTWQVTTADAQKINNWAAGNIDMSGLDSCRRLILQKLLNTGGINTLGRILAKIDNATGNEMNVEKFKVEYIFVDTLKFDEAGRTTHSSYNTVTGIFSTKILINKDIALNATDLFNANTFLHETIHAYMTSFLYRRQAGATISQLLSMSPDSVFDAYIDTLNAWQNNVSNYIGNEGMSADFEHNYMAEKLLHIMSEALQKYADNPLVTDRYAWYLAWNGLQKTRPMVMHWSNVPNWSPNQPYYTTDDSTRGLKYALTLQRLDTLVKTIRKEFFAEPAALGKKPLPAGYGCY